MLVLTSQVKFCKTIDKNPLWWFLTLWSSWKTITLHLLFFFVQDKFNFTDCRTLVHWFLVFLKVGELTCDSDILLWIKNMLRKRHYLFKMVCKFEVNIYWAWINFLMSMLCLCKMKCKMSCLTLEFFFFSSYTIVKLRKVLVIVDLSLEYHLLFVYLFLDTITFKMWYIWLNSTASSSRSSASAKFFEHSETYHLGTFIKIN